MHKTFSTSGCEFRYIMRHSQTEIDKGHRQNELQEVERSSDGATGYGAQNQGSPMRHRLRSSGAMEGQVRTAVLHVRAMAK